MVRWGALPFLLAGILAFLLPVGLLEAGGGGYSLNRIVVWGKPGEPPPRFQQDPETRAFILLFPRPLPEPADWTPVAARRFIARRGAFSAAEPISLLRPNDPDPDWLSLSTEASLDLNRDGRAEMFRARNVLVPDERDPSTVYPRILMELVEENRILFGDLLEGPGGSPARIHSLAAVDFTGEGYTDLIVRLEGEGLTGIAFYSQAPLRFPGVRGQAISGFSTTAFRCDRYGIFDLRRAPQEFLAKLPRSARAEDDGCPLDPPAARGPSARPAERRQCRFRFASAYLGWIQGFRVEFIPGDRLLSFDLFFPVSGLSMPSEQVLGFLTPVLGGGYTEKVRSEGEERFRSWLWEGNGARATLTSRDGGAGGDRALSLRLERD